jgi:hypothetical protein
LGVGVPDIVTLILLDMRSGRAGVYSPDCGVEELQFLTLSSQRT